MKKPKKKKKVIQSAKEQFDNTVQGQIELAIDAGKDLPRYGDIGVRCGWH